MRNSHRLTLSAHGAIELALGLATMILPAALAFTPAALLVCVGLGAILTGAALGALVPRPGSGHMSFDAAFGLVVAVAALGLAVTGQATAVILLAGLVLLHAGLRAATRRTLPG